MSMDKSIKGKGNQFVEEESNKKERKEKKKEREERERERGGKKNRCSDDRNLSNQEVTRATL